MNKNKIVINGGIGFSGLLTIVFIVLKIMHVIDWKWIWVLSPIWTSAGIALLISLPVIILIHEIRKELGE